MGILHEYLWLALGYTKYNWALLGTPKILRDDLKARPPVLALVHIGVTHRVSRRLNIVSSC